MGNLTFFPDGEPCGDAEYDAGGLAGHGLDPDKPWDVDPVEVALDLGDPGPLGSRADVDAGRGQSSRRHVEDDAKHQGNGPVASALAKGLVQQACQHLVLVLQNLDEHIAGGGSLGFYGTSTKNWSETN